MNNNKLKKECESIRTILYPISKPSKQNPQNNTNQDRPHLVQSVVSACKTACHKRSSTEIKNMREVKQHQKEPQKVFKDKNDHKASIETLKDEKNQNTNFIFKIPRTKPCAENKQKKLENSQRSMNILKAKKEKQKKKEGKEEEEDDGPIVLLPCSNCCHTTVVYPCSCGKRVYCGTVCQVGHTRDYIGFTLHVFITEETLGKGSSG